MTWLMAIPGAFKLLPRWAWEVIAAGLAIALAVHWYHGQIAKAEKRGADAAYSKVASQALELKGKADDLARSAASAAKEKNDEAHGRIDAHADGLLVRGPGRATCTGVAGSATAADQRPVQQHETDASVPRLPDARGTELIAVPFAGAVAFARQNDRCIADLRSYEQRDGLIAAGTHRVREGAKP